MKKFKIGYNQNYFLFWVHQYYFRLCRTCSCYCIVILHIVGENIIGATKMRNNYGAIKFLPFPILLSLLEAIANRFLLLFAKREATMYCSHYIVKSTITKWEAIQKRNHEPT